MSRNMDNKWPSGLTQYTPHEIKNLTGNTQIEIAGSMNDIYRFIDKALTPSNRGKKMLVGRINETLGGRIEQDTGINLRGYNFELRSDEIKHLMKEHGSETTELPRGQRALTIDDLYRIVNVVTDYDIVVPARDKSLHFKKNIEGGNTVVTLYANRPKSLSPKTVYARRK